MAAGLIHLLDVLNSVAPPPVSKFLSFCGSLDTQEVRTLAAALQKSTFNGGLRLKGGHEVGPRVPCDASH